MTTHTEERTAYESQSHQATLDPYNEQHEGERWEGNHSEVEFDDLGDGVSSEGGHDIDDDEE